MLSKNGTVKGLKSKAFKNGFEKGIISALKNGKQHFSVSIAYTLHIFKMFSGF